MAPAALSARLSEGNLLRGISPEPGSLQHGRSAGRPHRLPLLGQTMMTSSRGQPELHEWGVSRDPNLRSQLGALDDAVESLTIRLGGLPDVEPMEWPSRADSAAEASYSERGTRPSQASRSASARRLRASQAEEPPSSPSDVLLERLLLGASCGGGGSSGSGATAASRSLKSKAFQAFPRSERSIPEVFVVASDDGYSGKYTLVEDLRANEMPVWQREGSFDWIFCGNDGRWLFGGEEAKERYFDVDEGNLKSRSKANGRLPDEMAPAGGWLLFDGEEWLEAPTVNIAPWPVIHATPEMGAAQQVASMQPSAATTEAAWKAPGSSHGGGRCQLCVEKSAAVRKLALALCELGSRFVWMSGLTEAQRLSLGELVLEAATPCAGLDSGVEMMVEQLRKSVRRQSFEKKEEEAAQLPPEDQKLEEEVQKKADEEEWKLGWEIGSDPRLWNGLGLAFAEGAKSDPDALGRPGPDRTPAGDRIKKLKELQHMLNPFRRQSASEGYGLAEAAETKLDDLRQPPELTEPRNTPRRPVGDGRWVLLGGAGGRGGRGGTPGRHTAMTEAPLDLLGQLRLEQDAF
eukprot:TRINITY_DN74832_c0_g1_i1.p1 TRINITY_DN74832_c0_g1~~TRINITY_DN74832_c0_g1_i1.p1  ORF type:complete len:575 (-),score=162.55 TRINITY_DN74832_c0_g1_i1:143-1867(-)